MSIVKKLINESNKLSLNNTYRVNVKDEECCSVSISITNTYTPTAGNTVDFKATPIGWYETPSYQWKKNGSNVGTNSSTYSLTLTNYDDNAEITCVLSPSTSCPDTTSNTITLSVYYMSGPTIMPWHANLQYTINRPSYTYTWGTFDSDNFAFVSGGEQTCCVTKGSNVHDLDWITLTCDLGNNGIVSVTMQVLSSTPDYDTCS